MPTKIEWTRGDDGSPGETWNPTRGCSMAPGSETGGCLNCYAARNQLRRPYQTASSGKPFAILRDSGPRWSGEVELIKSKLAEPLHWRNSRRVFVNSMSDLFHEALPYPDILHVFQVMAKCQRHTFQILTKRHEKMRELLNLCWWRNLGYSPAIGGDYWVKVIAGEQRASDQNFLPNVWLGVSVEDQPTADARIPELLRTPAAVRFVSYEPALAGVNFRPFLGCGHREYDDIVCPMCGDARVYGTWLDWIIIGGESGPDARPFDIEWARNTIRQCKAAGLPVFVKQLGAHVIQDGERRIKRDKKGGDMHEWPHDLRIREFPRFPRARQSTRKAESEPVSSLQPKHKKAT